MMKKLLLNKKICERLMAGLMLLGLLGCIETTSTLGISAYAAENEDALSETEANSSNDMIMNSMLKATSHIDAMSEPDKGADVVFSYENGDTILVTGTDGDWYEVMFQGQTGYIVLGDADMTGRESQSAVAVSVLGEEGEVEDLNAEFAVVNQESTLVSEEVYRYWKNRTQSIIWGSIIVVLVAIIFVAGIYSSVKNKRLRKEDEIQEAKDVQEEQKMNQEEILSECVEINEIPQEESENHIFII